jgi:pimeloyl-ACP methyl ester carboxylesterase
MYRTLFFFCIWLLGACIDSPERIDTTPSVKDSITQALHADSLYQYQILPQATDSKIASSVEPHLIYLDTRIKSRNKLLIFLSGTASFPRNYQRFTELAATLGYHVISTNYLNSVGVTKCAQQSDMECFEQFHREVIFGNQECDFVNVNEANSINNRVVKLLEMLSKQFPSQDWSQYINKGLLNYENIVIAGHSQGGGHAAYWAHQFPFSRVIMFASPNDYSERFDQTATWCRTAFATSLDKFYGLIHKRDEIVPVQEQYSVWKDIGLLAQGDTVSADAAAFVGRHALFINDEPNPNAKPRLHHNVPVRDDALPEGESGEHIKSVWRYFLEQ